MFWVISSRLTSLLLSFLAIYRYVPSRMAESRKAKASRRLSSARWIMTVMALMKVGARRRVTFQWGAGAAAFVIAARTVTATPRAAFRSGVPQLLWDRL
jgi:hypothetical protein